MKGGRYETRKSSPFFPTMITLSDLTENETSSSRRFFSDKLFGYSPMSPATPTPSTPLTPDGQQPRIPTAKEVTTAGGVWAPTSAKRDKINELKIELEQHQESLDDAATTEQLQDLYLVDGIKLIVKTADSVSDSDTREIQEFSEWLVQQQQKMPEKVDKDKLEAHLAILSTKITKILDTISATGCLQDVRDFLDPNSIEDEDEDRVIPSTATFGQQDKAFDKSVLLFRLQLTKGAIDHLISNWDDYTKVSDGDVDRAAVKGEVIEPQVKDISLAKIYAYLFAHMSGTCSERVDTCWQLLDHDEDGLLDEAEMNVVAQMCLAPVQAALQNIFQDALDASPLRGPPATTNSNGQVPAPTMSWRQRRQETKLKKTFNKLFQKACKNHFEDEVEINHRLRCIYAWAEKAHQDNKLDSVLVEDGGWSGKKRYVELSPKISLPEFREVQQEHFTHLDRIGAEIMKSYREDIWILQGKGRQNRELVRDSFLFLTIVSICDYLILAS